MVTIIIKNDFFGEKDYCPIKISLDLPPGAYSEALVR